MKNKISLFLGSLLLSVFMILPFETTVWADDSGLYYEANQEDSSSEGNLTYASGVTGEMCDADYWKNLSVLGADRLLATKEDVSTYNDCSFNDSGTNVYGIDRKTSSTYTAKNRLSNEFSSRTNLYVDGEPVNTEEYYDTLKQQYDSSAYTEGSVQNYGYGIVVKRSDQLVWPTDSYIGYSATDSDNENENSALVVNEPFLVQQKCTVDGKEYYWGMSDNCTGWVSAENIALCKDRTEWLAAWKFDLTGKDFLVVTQDKIVLEASINSEYSSKLQLDLGCALPLVPQSEWDSAVSDLAERGTWNNYVVYIPLRDEDGNYVKKCALISQHYDVSIGYLDVTEANILDVAFSCLGNRYGWGGMLEAVDCSFYVRNIYRCFGYTLPRNTSWQTKVTEYATDVSGMTVEEKEKYLETLPAGSLLYFNGHVFMYTGSVDGTNYAISATGSVSDSTGDLDVKSIYSVILNPITVRRRNGNSWISELNTVVTFTDLRHTDHVVVTDPAVKATCLTTGLTEGTHCSLCNKVLTAQEVVARAAHEYDQGEVIASKDQTQQIIKYTCKVCGAEKLVVNKLSVIPDNKLSLKGISHSISAGKTIKLTCKITPNNATNRSVVWKSSNKKVATVTQDGVVKVKKNTGGKTAVITATSTDGTNITAAYLIKSKKGAVKNITIKGAKTLAVNKAAKLKAKVKATKGANKKVKWSCDNTDYATVSSKGVVKAKAAGKGKKVTITAISTDGTSKKATFTIKIK